MNFSALNICQNKAICFIFYVCMFVWVFLYACVLHKCAYPGASGHWENI